ncbi:MAG: Grx4 family monothiol glutaredoxin [Pseudomonadota bacterium]|nr:Grx4 family monothiol glutaredoxin [Pseudomonadota bacterium]
MSIIDRIKRRLPILGGAPAPTPVRTVSLAPRQEARVEEEEREEASPRGDKPVATFIDELVKGNAIVLFMKGTPQSPQCGFSAGASGILNSYGKAYAHVNVLADPDIREGVKSYTSWPTIPQVFVGGEFVGGSDILKQLHESGELKDLIAKAHPAS